MERKIEKILKSYLKEIENELEAVPRASRMEFIAEIRSHLLGIVPAKYGHTGVLHFSDVPGSFYGINNDERPNIVGAILKMR